MPKKAKTGKTKRARPKKVDRKSATQTVKKSAAATKPGGKVAAQKTSTKISSLTAQVYDINGKKQGTISLPKEIFAKKPNQKLTAQALHVYFTNSTAHYGSTKTRSEVRGGGAKPWRQKGTGRARAGSRRSPLWVGGATTFGPKARYVQLALPKKMKRLALVTALSEKAEDGQIKVISNLEKIGPKTRVVVNFLKKLESKGSTLFVLSSKNENVKLATRNIESVTVNVANNLNAYEIAKNRNIFLSKEALANLPAGRQTVIMKRSFVIKQAVLSEKTYRQMEDGKYTFLVNRYADKKAIAKAVENQFSVKVTKVNVLTKASKTKRIARTRKTVKTASGKKAVVYLQKGQSITMLSPKTAAKDKKAKVDQDKSKDKNEDSRKTK